jgi:hypothetical protein
MDSIISKEKNKSIVISEVEKFRLAQSKLKSHLPEFGKDLYSFCKFIKEKYGVWINAHFSETGQIITGLDLEQVNRICSCQD